MQIINSKSATSGLETENAEEERIRKAYARRNLVSWRYSLFNPSQLLSTHELEAGVLRMLKQNQRENLSSQKILEIGCGSGYWLRRMAEWGASPENLTGIDLLPDRISEAARLSPQGFNLLCGSAVRTAFPDGSFDLVFQFTVFTSILDRQFKRAVAAEMLRIVKPSGLIVWYDYRVDNPRNPDVRGIGKAEIRMLFPTCEVELLAVTLAPPISRILAPYSRTMCSMLSKIPALRTHYLGSIRALK